VLSYQSTPRLRATTPSSARGLIARSQKARGGGAGYCSPIAPRIQVPSALLSSDLTAYLVEEVVQFFLRYLGLHPAGIPRVEDFPERRPFISTLRDRTRGGGGGGGEGGDEEDRQAFVSSNVTSRALSFPLVFADDPERRHLFLGA